MKPRNDTGRVSSAPRDSPQRHRVPDNRERHEPDDRFAPTAEPKQLRDLDIELEVKPPCQHRRRGEWKSARLPLANVVKSFACLFDERISADLPDTVVLR